MEDLRIRREGVFEYLLMLDPKKSCGPDEIPTAFLQRYTEWMSYYLQLLFEKSLRDNSVPQDWRDARVVPIHKGGDKLSVTNYRPVSITSVCCKVLEHMIAKHIINFLEKNDLLCLFQHGFRSGLSTVTQLIETVHDLCEAIDECKQVDVVCIDFAKAFDKVPHHKLLYKLRRLGISAAIVSWIEGYLRNRFQSVRIGTSVSEKCEVLSGVPQGSVLGPLLFLLYINDIPAIVNPPVKIKLFADDCLIYSRVLCANDQTKLNKSLQALDLWCQRWGMEINYKKTTYTHVTRKRDVLKFEYNIGKYALTEVQSFRYLGVTVAHNLDWRIHVDNTYSKVYQKLCFLRRKLTNATKELKLVAYKTFIRPVLEYANVVWSPHKKGLKKKVEKIQRLAARFICSRYRRADSVTDMLQQCGLELLESRRTKQWLKFLFQILYGSLELDKEHYVKAPTKLGYRKNHSRAIRTVNTHTDVYRYSFFPDVIEIWNVVECSGVQQFELAIDMFFKNSASSLCS